MEFGEERRVWNNRGQCWIYYDRNGAIHRDGGEPALVCKSGYKMWFLRGWKIGKIKKGLYDYQLNVQVRNHIDYDNIPVKEMKELLKIKGDDETIDWDFSLLEE